MSLSTPAERPQQQHVQLPSVLLVDDRPENLLAFEATLEPLGVRLVRANNAAEALKHVLEEDFAVILLDVQMPGMNGYEVARRIKAMAPPRLTPIIFITALDRDRRQVHAGYESGAVDYLFKPLEPEVLRQKVAAFVRLYKEQEAEALRQRQRYADLTEEAAHRAARLLERITDAHVVMDRDFSIQTVNAAAERTLGQRRDLLIGRSYWDALPAAAGSALERQLRRVQQDRVDAHFTHHLGDEHDLHLEIDAYPTEEGGVALFSCDVTERVRAERALRESETRYRTLFESLDEGFCIIEVLFDESGAASDYRFLETNPAFVRQTGLVNAVGRSIHELVPANESHWFETFGRVAATGEPVRFQNVAKALQRHYDVYAFRIGRPDDHHVAILFTDVTADKEGELERERLIRALEIERTRLADILRQAPVAVAVLRGRVARDLVYELANPRFVEMVPGRRSPVGRRIDEVIPEAREALYAALQQVLDTGEPFLATDYRVPLDRNRDGVPEDYFFNFVYHPLVEADGSVSGIVDIGTEVTESVRARRVAEQLQHAAEQARDDAERAHHRATRLQALTAALAGTRTLDDVAAVVVAQGVDATRAKTGMLAVLGPTIDEVTIIRQTGISAELVAEYQRFPITAPGTAARCLRTGEPQWVESREALLADFPEIAQHVEALDLHAVATVPLLVANSVMGAITFTFTEPRTFPVLEREFFLSLGRQAAQAVERAQLVEAERVARAEAEMASRTKSQFLANMSHELRTPLNAIAGHLQLIQMGIHGAVSDPQREALARIDRAQRHLLGLINDVLNYARIEAGRVEYDLEPVQVRDVLSDVLPMVESQVGAKALTLDTPLKDELGAEPVHVWADRDKLGQVLLNVLSNAVKFTQQGGRITVALSDAEDVADSVTVRISDTGVGIPIDKLEAVFEPFVQVRSDFTRQVEGTGLGLAISRDLARGMGGDLRARSELGVGSTFELILRRVVNVGGSPTERRSRQDRRTEPERRSGEERRVAD
ncbi:MAG TPA: ATP-binding protein [Gemmatimonadaceae bacterium]|nr:ATP-binding protein [Gemmatimonadaceae bacterium]